MTAPVRNVETVMVDEKRNTDLGVRMSQFGMVYWNCPSSRTFYVIGILRDVG